LCKNGGGALFSRGAATLVSRWQERTHDQGVGFRVHVQFYAQQIGVTGCVQNLGWDTVEAAAEGEKEKADRFIEMVKEGPGG
jgi:hypothetical protein